MYKVYWTNQDTYPASVNHTNLKEALEHCEFLRKAGKQFVTMVSDYQNMVGKPGASGIDSSYVPQMLN